MKKCLAAVCVVVFACVVGGCASTPKPITDEQFQHKEAMSDLDKQLDKEEKKKKEQEGATPN